MPYDALDTDALDTDALDTDALDTDALDTDALDTDALDTDALDRPRCSRFSRAEDGVSSVMSKLGVNGAVCQTEVLEFIAR